jgi:hypothetical protein
VTLPLVSILVSLLTAPQVVEPEELTRRLSGKQVQIEDLVTSVLGSGDNRRLRLLRCNEVSFRLPESAPKEITGNVRVSGLVQVEGSQVIVQVQRVELLPSDIDQFEKRRQAIDPKSHADWYSLAEWAENRFQLYRDSKLHSAAIESFRRGVELERAESANDFTKLKALRARLIEAKIVTDWDIAEIDHHLAVARLPNLMTATADELEQAAKRWEETFNLSPDAWIAITPAEQAAYEQNPVATYRSASEVKRKGFLRWGQVRLLRLVAEKRVSTRQWDPYQAADWTDEKIPDQPAIGRGWFEKGVSADEARLTELRFRDADKLASRIIDRLQDSDRANKLRGQWLDLTEATMRQHEDRAVEEARLSQRPAPLKDVRTRYDLAQQRLGWFPKDAAHQAKGANLLLEAIEIEPAFEPAIEALRGLGYRRTSAGAWQDPLSAAKEDREQAEMPRSAAIGMEEATVIKIHGPPDSKTRIITGPRLVEWQWRYDGMKQATFINFRTDGAGRWRVSDIRRLAGEASSAIDHVE